MATEHLVGLLDLERAGVADWMTAEVNRQAADFAARTGYPLPRALTDKELMRIRTRMRELHGQWAATPAGGTLELVFDPTDGP